MNRGSSFGFQRGSDKSVRQPRKSRLSLLVGVLYGNLYGHFPRIGSGSFFGKLPKARECSIPTQRDYFQVLTGLIELFRL